MQKPLDKLTSLVFDDFGPPRYEQLAGYIERAIRSGEFGSGDRLPTVRQLTSTMGISATTISSAFDLLRKRKLVRAEIGRGTFVVPDWREAAGASMPVPNTIARRVEQAITPQRNPWRRNALMRASSRLRSAYPNGLECSTGRPDPRLLPVEPLKKAWTKSMRAIEPRDLQYEGTDPIPSLAEALSRHLEDDHIPARPTDLLIGSSAQQFFALACEVLQSRAFGPRLLVAVEEPGYPTLMDTLERYDSQLIGIAVDHYGAVPASLDSALRQGAQMVVLTPRGHNPTGASWSPERLVELGEVIQQYPDVIVLEDDQMAGIASTRCGSLLSIRELENRVVYLRSFSKSIAPDLRMAAAVARPALREPLADAKSFADGWSSRLLQRVLLHALQSDELHAELAAARDAYRQRRQNAGAALNRWIAARGAAAWVSPDGVNVWVQLPAGVDSKEAQERSAAAGVRVADGEPFFLAPGRSDVIRLNAGSVSAEEATHAGEIVGKAILDCEWHNRGPIHV